MGDGGTRGITEFESRVEIAMDVAAQKGAVHDARGARKVLEEAISKIPEASLKGFRGFRITVLA